MGGRVNIHLAAVSKFPQCPEGTEAISRWFDDALRLIEILKGVPDEKPEQCNDMAPRN